MKHTINDIAGIILFGVFLYGAIAHANSVDSISPEISSGQETIEAAQPKM